MQLFHLTKSAEIQIAKTVQSFDLNMFANDMPVLGLAGCHWQRNGKWMKMAGTWQRRPFVISQQMMKRLRWVVTSSLLTTPLHLEIWNSSKSQKRKKKKEPIMTSSTWVRSFTSFQMFHTHTHATFPCHTQHFHTQLFHTTLSHTQPFLVTHNSFTHSSVTHSFFTQSIFHIPVWISTIERVNLCWP